MKRSHLMRSLALAAGLLSLSLQPVQAHHIWIEQDAQGAALYFGEFSENLREVSPGLLDKFTQTRARLIRPDGEQLLTPVKNAQAFTLSVQPRKGDTIVAEADYPLYDKKEGDNTLRGVWMPAARFITSFEAHQPVLTLDIVPTGETGEFQVVYRGKPLSKTTVTAIAVSGWSRDAQTDDAGKVRFDFPWQGMYGIEVKHNDKTPGERGNEKYDTASYVTTLSLVQTNGLASPPAPDKRGPNK